VTASEEFLQIWLVFLLVAVGMVLGALLVGALIRPRRPTPEKLAPYECGEEPIGGSKVQYDVRIYVAALLFLIFEIEVALFFPAGMLLGQVNRLRREYRTVGQNALAASQVASQEVDCVSAAGTLRQRPAGGLGSDAGTGTKSFPGSGFATIDREQQDVPAAPGAERITRGMEDRSATLWVWAITVELAVFFAVLLVGYAYLWWCGDLDWVRDKPAGSN
jgi:NADH-quinone oxidoreductase subunit A